MSIEIKNGCYVIDGQKHFLISGEIQYYRVPKKDWKERLIKLIEMGGNCVATYVPWIIHEPLEGDIRWNDIESRDLCGFLDLCKELSLNVMLRPGPLQYSELVNGGIPRWLFRDYPELQLYRIDGTILENTVSYMHPAFLEKARNYYREFAKITKKYMKKNGGPVSIIQVDNELMGCHMWNGTIDYNPQTCGFYCENGRYACYLKKLYGTIENLNKAYHKSYKAFSEVYPEKYESHDIYSCRQSRDYFNFYLDMNGEYLANLSSWLREDGIEEYICHNSANANMNGLFDSIINKQESGFLLGSDYYYNLNQTWKQNNPTPQYALSMFFSSEQLRNMNMPPTAFELPGGSCSDYPPILSEDLYACYAANIALGLKGLNYYIFTGGPNFEDTGSTCDIYDFNALIRADGKINSTYYAAQKISQWLSKNKWLQSAERITSVNVAYENEFFRAEEYQYENVDISQTEAISFIRNGILYSLMCTEYSPALIDVSRKVPDINKPLIVCAPSVLSRKSQLNIVEFLKRGGNLLLLGTLPLMDETYISCTILRDYLDINIVPREESIAQPLVLDECNSAIFDLKVKTVIEERNEKVIARNRISQEAVMVEKEIGKSKVIFGTISYILSLDSQVDMIKNLLKRFNASPVVAHSNRHVFVTYYEGENEEKVLFLLNLYSGRNTTNINIAGNIIENIQLEPMEVKIITL